MQPFISFFEPPLTPVTTEPAVATTGAIATRICRASSVGTLVESGLRWFFEGSHWQTAPGMRARSSSTAASSNGESAAAMQRARQQFEELRPSTVEVGADPEQALHDPPPFSHPHRRRLNPKI